MIYGEYRYTHCMRKILAFSVYGVENALELIQKHLDGNRGGYFVGYLTYEAGVLLQSYKAQPYNKLYENVAGLTPMQDSADSYSIASQFTQESLLSSGLNDLSFPHQRDPSQKQPLLYFALFAKRYRLDSEKSYQTDCPTQNLESTPPSRIFLDIQSSSYSQLVLQNLKAPDFERYCRDFDSVKQYIARGESYQINYTQELHFVSQIESDRLFAYLCEFQNTPYRAYICNPFATILCFSPELFFKIKNGIIIAQPMKGTMQRYTREDSQSQTSKSDEEWLLQDEALKKALQTDIKNRSENVMIVDLLRNDLSKILVPNSLVVRELCAIHTYPSLHQMVSTLEGELGPSTSLLQIFKALFPCGSITGAPKLKSMEHIYALESRTRGVYCGALGVISNEEISMCVPIRTLMRYPQEVFYRYGVGSGVVWDSDCDSEFAELILKSSFLKATPLESFALFETMLYQNGRIILLREHMERLLSSARAFGFPKEVLGKLEIFLDSISFRQREKIRTLPHMDLLWEYERDDEAQNFFRFCNAPSELNSDRVIVRLVLEYSGVIKIEFKPYILNSSHFISLSTCKVSSANPFVYHKSTERQHLSDKAYEIESGVIFDCVYLNEQGELCEGTRSNLVLELDGRFYTPRVESGLLGGTLRRVLIESKLVEERVLGLEDLYNAQSLWCVNSVRGVVRVQLKELRETIM